MRIEEDFYPFAIHAPQFSELQKIRDGGIILGRFQGCHQRQELVSLCWELPEEQDAIVVRSPGALGISHGDLRMKFPEITLVGL